MLYLPEEAQFSALIGLPEGENIGAAINAAMNAIEAENPDLRGVLPKTYNRFENALLKELLKTMNSVPMDIEGDAFGKIYEYFLGHFAMSEGQKGGEFFTPTAIVQLIVGIIEPFHGRIFDPACGSVGMFVQSAHFVEEHKGKPSVDLSIFGQERVAETVRLGKMNLAVHGLAGDIRQGNTYYEDLHHSVGRFDFVMANPPFNVDRVDKERLKDDRRFPFGLPRTDNANYLWIQLFYSALADKGRAGFVMANSAADARSSELKIRKKLIEMRVVDVMVAVGSNFFYTVTLPCTLWFFDKGKRQTARADKVLFINARHIYRQIDRAHRDWTPAQIEFLANIARLYRGEQPEDLHGSEHLLSEHFGNECQYADVAGLCKVATIDEIEAQGWSLNPGRYVGVAERAEEDFDFKERLQQQNEELERLKAEAQDLERCIADIEEQRKIATVLSVYDDLIENNLRRIKILEEMARNLYREWFVKFRFPGHEKARFVDSPLGKIPEGWEVKSLSEVCNLTMGQSPKSEFYNESGDGLPFHQGVTDFGSRFPTTRLYCTVKNRIAEAGDILFSVKAPVRRINIAPTQTAIGRGLSAIRHSGGYQNFAFYMLKERFKEEDLIGGGTIFKSVTKADMQGIEFLSADNDLHIEFEKIVSPLEKQIENITKKNAFLIRTRDLLLPKLISGEIDVSNLTIQTDKNDIRRYDFFQQICRLPFVDKIVLFGSRARGDHHDRSDIDLAVSCDQASDAEWQQVLDCLREDRIDTLFKVDCVRFECSNAALKEHIMIEGKVLYEKSGQQTSEQLKKRKEPTIMSENKLANHLFNSQRCLKRLDDVIRQPLDEDMFMLDAVVHRFNMAFELLMDTLLVYCVETDLLPKEKVKEYELNTRKLIELAFDCKLIDDDQTWVAIKDARNATAHEYDEQQALAYYNKVKSYLPHLQALFEKMNTIADDVAEDVSYSAKNPDADN